MYPDKDSHKDQCDKCRHYTSDQESGIGLCSYKSTRHGQDIYTHGTQICSGYLKIDSNK